MVMSLSRTLAHPSLSSTSQSHKPQIPFARRTLRFPPNNSTSSSSSSMSIAAPPKIPKLSSLVRKESSSTINYVKYRGLGNDFILVDNRDSLEPRVTPELVVMLCDGNYGIGADGVIFLMPGVNGTDYTTMIFNSDGSECEMLGNGMRCFAQFIAELENFHGTRSFTVHTGAGIIALEIHHDGKNEATIKFSTQFQRSEPADMKEPATEFESFSNVIHGRTMGALALRSKENYRISSEPVIPGVKFSEYGIIEDGALRTACGDKGAPLIIDEVKIDMGQPVLSAPDVPNKLPANNGGVAIQAELVVDGISRNVTCVSMGNPQSDEVKVDMGQPVLSALDVPNKLPLNNNGAAKLVVDGLPWNATCVSMVNPHCVTFGSDHSEALQVGGLKLEEIGSKVEHPEMFPSRTNTGKEYTYQKDTEPEFKNISYLLHKMSPHIESVDNNVNKLLKACHNFHDEGKFSGVKKKCEASFTLSVEAEINKISSTINKMEVQQIRMIRWLKAIFFVLFLIVIFMFLFWYSRM